MEKIHRSKIFTANCIVTSTKGTIKAVKRDKGSSGWEHVWSFGGPWGRAPWEGGISVNTRRAWSREACGSRNLVGRGPRNSWTHRWVKPRLPFFWTDKRAGMEGEFCFLRCEAEGSAGLTGVNLGSKSDGLWIWDDRNRGWNYYSPGAVPPQGVSAPISFRPGSPRHRVWAAWSPCAKQGDAGEAGEGFAVMQSLGRFQFITEEFIDIWIKVGAGNFKLNFKFSFLQSF